MNQRIGPGQVLDRRPDNRIGSVVQGLAFWCSILLPLSYLPMLYATSGTAQYLGLTALILLNLCCLVVGHNHSP